VGYGRDRVIRVDEAQAKIAAAKGKLSGIHTIGPIGAGIDRADQGLAAWDQPDGLAARSGALDDHSS
jgi:hypothetical protein